MRQGWNRNFEHVRQDVNRTERQYCFLLHEHNIYLWQFVYYTVFREKNIREICNVMPLGFRLLVQHHRYFNLLEAVPISIRSSYALSKKRKGFFLIFRQRKTFFHDLKFVHFVVILSLSWVLTKLGVFSLFPTFSFRSYSKRIILHSTS